MKWKHRLMLVTDVDELKTLFTWTQDAEGNTTRPLVSFPEVI
jgi:hypothetical protein